jgi:GNAT superfamily N-acetyltransferase
MIYQLETSQFEQARHLFRHLEQHQPMCTSVLAGVYPGKVFVDGDEYPRSGLLTTFIESEASGTWGFLAGDPSNQDFNRSLNTAIFERQIVHPETPVMLLTCDPADWGGQMEIVMSPRPPIWMPRWHFVGRQASYDWRSSLPEGFSVQPMRVNLLDRGELDLPEDVCATLEKWSAAQNEQFGDFGFITIDESGDQPIIAGWATVDFVAEARGDLGFFTQPDYRRKGLGTIAASAALEHGLVNGLVQINWTCDAGNQGSIRTAEKLGLERIEDYRMALLVFDEAEHMSNLGYFALKAKNYTQSAIAFAKALDLNPESPHFIYYEAAQAMAMTGNTQKALDFLLQAVQRGCNDVEHAQMCEAFESIRELPEWKVLIKKMEKAT